MLRIENKIVENIIGHCLAHTDCAFCAFNDGDILSDECCLRNSFGEKPYEWNLERSFEPYQESKKYYVYKSVWTFAKGSHPSSGLCRIDDSYLDVDNPINLYYDHELTSEEVERYELYFQYVIDNTGTVDGDTSRKVAKKLPDEYAGGYKY